MLPTQFEPSGKKIEKTEAAIVENKFDGRIATITLLAGSTGYLSVKLFSTTREYHAVIPEMRPYLSLAITLSAEKNTLKFATTSVNFTLLKNDKLKFIFEDGGSTMVYFFSSSVKIGNERVVFTFIDDAQLLQMLDNDLVKIEAYDSKFRVTWDFDFSAVPNDQYTTRHDGSELLRIMLRRLIGLKVSLRKE